MCEGCFKKFNKILVVFGDLGKVLEDVFEIERGFVVSNGENCFLCLDYVLSNKSGIFLFVEGNLEVFL